MSKIKLDLKGKKYGKLTAIEPVGKNKHNVAIWKCRCECGNIIYRSSNVLKLGHCKSCGCLGRAIPGIKIADPRLYNIWHDMVQRCNDPKSKYYKNYGARGISVCKEWLKLEPFYNWALLNGYKPNLTIDRKDNNDDYCPDNCRWITHEEQQRNKRSNHIIEFRGKKQILTQWAQEIGISPNTLISRLKHWSIERALTTPVNKNYGKYRRKLI